MHCHGSDAKGNRAARATRFQLRRTSCNQVNCKLASIVLLALLPDERSLFSASRGMRFTDTRHDRGLTEKAIVGVHTHAVTRVANSASLK